MSSTPCRSRRWFLVIQLDNVETYVQAVNHTQAKLKAAKYQNGNARGYWGYRSFNNAGGSAYSMIYVWIE